MTIDFVNEHKIDIVVHGFANDQDREKQNEFFKEIREIGKFKEIGYYNKISTTEIINKLKN
jgi:glycerol-3-phosphate cytidylyltransferase-like family protein